MNMAILICFTIIAVVFLAGIFVTKTKGFGRYSTSVLLFAAILIIAGFCRLAALIDSTIFVNITFAVLGFAGGLVSNKVET